MEKYIYFWYDHMMLRGTKVIDYIKKAIEEHDWKTFCVFKKMLDVGDQYSTKGTKMIFFPNTILVLDEDGDFKEHIPLNEENFKKITENEYECG